MSAFVDSFALADSRLAVAGRYLVYARRVRLQISCLGRCFWPQLLRCCCFWVLPVCTDMRGLELFWSIVTGADSCFGRQTSRIRSLVANTRSKKLWRQLRRRPKHTMLCGTLMVLFSTNKLIHMRTFWRDLIHMGTDWHSGCFSPNRARVYWSFTHDFVRSTHIVPWNSDYNTSFLLSSTVLRCGIVLQDAAPEVCALCFVKAYFFWLPYKFHGAPHHFNSFLVCLNL